VDPGDPGNKTRGLDGTKNRPGLRIDLIDLPLLIMSHPERPFGPGEPRMTAAFRRRDRCQNLAGLWIDLLNTIIGDLIQMLAVKSCSCVCGDIHRADYLPARRI